MELNKEEIISAMNFCRSEGHICGKCPYRKVRFGISCRDKLLKDALSLINEFTEENEILRNSAVDYRNIPYIKEEVKADTVREMQEKIHEKAYTNNYCQEVVLLSDIDQITKEMLEGEK